MPGQEMRLRVVRVSWSSTHNTRDRGSTQLCPAKAFNEYHFTQIKFQRQRKQKIYQHVFSSRRVPILTEAFPQ